MIERFLTPNWNLYVLDRKTGKVLQSGRAPFQGAILGWTRDGQFLVTATDNQVTLWNPSTLEKVKDLAGSIRMIHSISPDARQVIFARGTRLRLWDITRDELLVQFDPDVGLIREAIFSADGQGLRVVGDRRSIDIHVEGVRQLIESNRLTRIAEKLRPEEMNP